jgi:hypothetical protein
MRPLTKGVSTSVYLLNDDDEFLLTDDDLYLVI